MSYREVNAAAVAQALQSNLNIYPGSPNMMRKMPTAPIPFMYAGLGVLLGPLRNHDPNDVEKVKDSRPTAGTFTITLKRSKFRVVIYAPQSSYELKAEIERCIRQATQANSSVDFEDIRTLAEAVAV